MQNEPVVAGVCAPKFDGLRHALADIMAAGTEVGAALAVCVDKEPVVDLWAGHADAARTRPWQRDTLVNLFSVGKAISAVCLLRLVEAGRVDLEAPVARYWPEFAQAGKARVPVRYPLTHQAGLPAVARALPPEAWGDWTQMTEALAAQEPWWEPGTGHGYHVNTQGFLIGEVIRRVTGQSIGAYFRTELGGPAGIDWHWGFGPEHDDRCADYLLPPPSPERDAFDRRLRGDGGPLEGLALMRLRAHFIRTNFSGMSIMNSRAWRAAEVPSTNGHGNARAVARLYAALATDGRLDGVHVLGPEMVARAIEEQAHGPDLVLERPTRYGLGFQLTMPARKLGPGPRAFGHFGAGGSLGFADPDARVAIGYAMNQGRPGWQHPHVRRLIDLVYAAL
jgi:CubicO group peptidase (beta-lactamase class C family)